MKAISLFSGVGGFDLGFERAGIETVLQVEQDKHCLAVLERHWPNVRRLTDVASVCVSVAGEYGRHYAGTDTGSDEHFADAGGIDIVYGGFPCQDVSVAGKRAGLDGERSGLWFEFHRILRELRPRWAVIENVPGLLSSNGGRDFGVILHGLGELGFHVGWAVLDAQHFGVPQRRRRVFVVAGPSRRSCEQVLSLCESCGGNPETSEATREGTAGSITASAGHHGHSSPRGDGSDNLVAYTVSPARGTGDGHGNAWNSNYVTAPALTASGRGVERTGESRGQDPVVVVGSLDTEVGGNKLTHQSAVNGHLLPTYWNGADVADTLDVSTLVNRQTMPDKGRFAAVTGQQGVRRLTPLECERLQGFPDGWTEGQSDSHRYRQMGNAVAVPVAEWIGHRLMAVES